MLHSLLRLGPLPQDLNRTAFRKTATRLTAAAMMLGGLAVSAKADDAASNFAAACASIKNGADRAGCMITAIEKNTAATKANTVRLKKEEQALDANIRCLTLLKDFKASNPVAFEKLGPITRENACAAASNIPRPTASLN